MLRLIVCRLSALPFDATPGVEVQIIPSNQHPQGIGEISNLEIAPVLANAVYALTGQRLRKLPLQLS